MHPALFPPLATVLLVLLGVALRGESQESRSAAATVLLALLCGVLRVGWHALLNLALLQWVGLRLVCLTSFAGEKRLDTWVLVRARPLSQWSRGGQRRLATCRPVLVLWGLAASPRLGRGP